MRIIHRLSQTQLADILRISARHLEEVGAGKRDLSFGILHEIAKRLVILLQEILDFESLQNRDETIGQILRCLERIPLSHLQAIQRIIRQFMEY